MSISLSLILLTSAGSIALQQQQQQANAQNTEESPISTTEENKNYMLVFGQRIV